MKTNKIIGKILPLSAIHPGNVNAAQMTLKSMLNKKWFINKTEPLVFVYVSFIECLSWRNTAYFKLPMYLLDAVP